MPLLAIILTGPQLGLGRKALEIVRGKAARKAISYTSYASQAESVVFQAQLAEAARRTDSAHLHAYRGADCIDTAACGARLLDLAWADWRAGVIAE